MSDSYKHKKYLKKLEHAKKYNKTDKINTYKKKAVDYGVKNQYGGAPFMRMLWNIKDLNNKITAQNNLINSLHHNLGLKLQPHVNQAIDDYSSILTDVEQISLAHLESIKNIKKLTDKLHEHEEKLNKQGEVIDYQNTSIENINKCYNETAIKMSSLINIIINGDSSNPQLTTSFINSTAKEQWINDFDSAALGKAIAITNEECKDRFMQYIKTLKNKLKDL